MELDDCILCQIYKNATPRGPRRNNNTIQPQEDNTTQQHENNSSQQLDDDLISLGDISPVRSLFLLSDEYDLDAILSLCNSNLGLLESIAE